MSLCLWLEPSSALVTLQFKILDTVWQACQALVSAIFQSLTPPVLLPSRL